MIWFTKEVLFIHINTSKTTLKKKHLQFLYGYPEGNMAPRR